MNGGFNAMFSHDFPTTRVQGRDIAGTCAKQKLLMIDDVPRRFCFYAVNLLHHNQCTTTHDHTISLTHQLIPATGLAIAGAVSYQGYKYWAEAQEKVRDRFDSAVERGQRRHMSSQLKSISPPYCPSLLEAFADLKQRGHGGSL